jgi:hypothetical protein
MELLQSIRYFFWGMLKRFYYWLPFVVLDIPDLWERYLEPFASTRLGWELKMPDTLTTILVFASLIWAGVLTYHELRQQKIKLEGQLDDKGKKKKRRETLGVFLEQGQTLKRKCANEKDPPPNEEADTWASEVESYLSDELDDSYISRFRSSAGVPLTANSISSIPHRRNS